MSSNTWGAERNHLKVTIKKEGVSERSVTRVVTNVSHADENKTLPLEGLLYNSAWWPVQKYSLVHMTDSWPHTCCCWCGLCPRCCRLQVCVFCAVLACFHERHPGKFPCRMCYSWQVSHSHGCAATAAAQELLIRLFLPCACVKEVSASVLCQAMKWSVSTPFEDLWQQYGPLTILGLRAQKQLSFINLSSRVTPWGDLPRKEWLLW